MIQKEKEFPKPIDELSEDELLYEFEKSLKYDGKGKTWKTTANFIIFWVEITTSSNGNKIKEKYPEYFI